MTTMLSGPSLKFRALGGSEPNKRSTYRPYGPRIRVSLWFRLPNIGLEIIAVTTQASMSSGPGILGCGSFGVELTRKTCVHHSKRLVVPRSLVEADP